MEKFPLLTDRKCLESSSSSMSELDRRFFGEQSFLSALSLEQLSTSRASDGSDSRQSGPAFPGLCSDAASPLPGVPGGGGGCCHLLVPLQGKSSTPCVLPHRPRKDGNAGNAPASPSLDQSSGDIAPAQMSWNLSVIQSENSPRPPTTGSLLESTWSPHSQSAQLSP